MVRPGSGASPRRTRTRNAAGRRCYSPPPMIGRDRLDPSRREAALRPGRVPALIDEQGLGLHRDLPACWNTDSAEPASSSSATIFFRQGEH